MSKAFKKDDDGEDEDQPDIPVDKSINYVTPNGHALLQNESRELLYQERPKLVEVVRWAAGNGDRSENGDYIYGKKRLREIDRRVRYLTKRLDSAKIVDPDQQRGLTRVFFGATVTYQDTQGAITTVQIVGIDEADLAQGKISWVSPVAKALLKAEVGNVVKLKTINGIKALEILEIRY